MNRRNCRFDEYRESPLTFGISVSIPLNRQHVIYGDKSSYQIQLNHCRHHLVIPTVPRETLSMLVAYRSLKNQQFFLSPTPQITISLPTFTST